MAETVEWVDQRNSETVHLEQPGLAGWDKSACARGKVGDLTTEWEGLVTCGVCRRWIEEQESVGDKSVPDLPQAGGRLNHRLRAVRARNHREKTTRAIVDIQSTEPIPEWIHDWLDNAGYRIDYHVDKVNNRSMPVRLPGNMPPGGAQLRTAEEHEYYESTYELLDAEAPCRRCGKPAEHQWRWWGAGAPAPPPPPPPPPHPRGERE
ncbi:hypothetical protein I6A62_02785, partial [Frankia sp. AgW1.1]|nr:hypothetical protein [Frankia sp. AgW1.1]